MLKLMVAAAAILAAVLAPSGAGSRAVVRTIPKLAIAFHTSFSASTQSGYKLLGTITTYKPVHAGSRLPALPYSHRSALVACMAAAPGDAVIPVSLTLTNLTRRFPGGLAFSIYGVVPSNGGLTGVGGDYVLGSGGPQCSDGLGNDMYIAQVTWPTVAGGATVRFDLYVVLNGYYSPRYPHGDPTLKGLDPGLALRMGPGAQQTMSQAAIDFRLL